MDEQISIRAEINYGKALVHKFASRPILPRSVERVRVVDTSEHPLLHERKWSEDESLDFGMSQRVLKLGMQESWRARLKISINSSQIEHQRDKLAIYYLKS